MRKIWPSLAFVMIAAWLLQGCGSPRKNFVGHVFGRDSQSPAAGVTVVAEDSAMWVKVMDPVVVTTDDRGRFTMRISDSESVHLLVDAVWHETADVVTRINGSGGTWRGESFRLTTSDLQRGGWLEAPPRSTLAVWFTPASKDLPPDFSDMNNPIPPDAREAQTTGNQKAP